MFFKPEKYVKYVFSHSVSQWRDKRGGDSTALDAVYLDK